jgi:peptidase M1-like protein
MVMPPAPARLLAALALLTVSSPAVAQQSRPVSVLEAPSVLQPAERYEPVFEQLQKLAPRADRVATVHGLTLRRDAIELHFETGVLYETTPVAGRSVGVVFVGSGSVSFVPPLVIERAQVKRVLGDSTVESPITGAAFVFADSTLAELERHVTFTAPGGGPPPAGPLGELLDHLLDARTHRVLQTALMDALLNGQENDFFYAQVRRERGEDLMFVVDPEDEEPIQLLRGGRERGEKYQLVSEFPREEERADTTTAAADQHEPLQLAGYRIEATVAKNLEFSATVTVRLLARRPGIWWVPLRLYSEMIVDSIRAPSESLYRAKDSPELWVRLPAPLAVGTDTGVITLSYHGDVIGFGSVMRQILQQFPDSHDPRLPSALDHWLYVKTSTYWFPRYGSPPQAADVDMTFHTPKRYRFAAIGQLTDSTVNGDVQTTHWVTERPADQVCFNLGEFDELRIAQQGVPPVTVQVNTDAHRQLGILLFGQRDPGGDVGHDVASSLGFFTNVYGPALFRSYYATEIPFGYGQAFPGLMYFSVGTFQTLDESGSQEMFRAHEMAHQWWGIGVEPASYRDAWLSEGFAEFSGLWFMQARLRDNEKFFKKLRATRHDIRARRNDAAPIALGYRVGDVGGLPQDYQTMVYDKGAWVLHMLRNLMLDLRTMKEDAFRETMQDFYRQYRGRRASTGDFQRVVEEHMGMSMEWFFDEWVRGTAVPTYILSWKSEPGDSGRHILHLRVRQEDAPASFIMSVPLEIVFADSSHAMVRVNVRGPSVEASLAVPSEPMRLELNPLESVLAEVRTESWR